LLPHLSVLRQIWDAPGNAPNRPLAVIRAIRWFIACHRKSVPDDQPVLFRAYGDRVYPCYTDSIIAKHVMYRSEWFDHDLLHFMHDYLRPGDHFLDIGANTGLHTILASTRITSGHITCVEPDPKNLTRLRRALDLNHITNATILPVAASDHAGSVQLTGADVFTRISPSPSGQLPSAINHPQSSSSDPSPTVVSAARLDALLGPDARVDFCKIDVEGAEWQVLKGMTGLMDRNALPVIAFEFNGGLRDYGHSEGELLSWLRDQGYSVAAYDHTRQELKFGTASSGPDTDLFAFTEAGVGMVKERIPEIQIRA
jgi:FkbM family methyltransferase